MKIQLLFPLLFLSATTFSQTVLAGKVTDGDTKEELIGASVKVMKGGETVKGSITDFNGEFRIPLDPGIYTIEASFTGYYSSKKDSVQVLSNTINYLNFTMSPDSTLAKVVIREFKIPLIYIPRDPYGGLTPEQLKNLPNYSVQQMAVDSTKTQPLPPLPAAKKKKKSRQVSGGGNKE
jgi:hypothetical protein